MANAAFAIRLSVDGARQAGAELRGVPEDAAKGVKTFGDSADRAGRQSRGLRADVTSVTPAMRSLDTAVKGVRGEFENFAGRVPIVGGALQALGPAGIAAAAGVAAITIGFTQMLQLSQQAIQQLGDLKDAADNVNLGVEDFQAFRAVARLEGIDAQASESMLQTLAINSARASEGFGKMHAALQKVNPELAEQLALSTTQAQRLDILAKAVQGAASYNDKLNIAVAAFGSEGAQMVRVLDETGASMDTWRQKAQAAGLVVEKDLIDRVDAIGKRMDELSAKSEVAGQRFGAAIAPAAEGLKAAEVWFLENSATFIDSAKALEDQTTHTLQQRRDYLAELVKTDNWLIYPIEHFKEQIAEIDVILQRREVAQRAAAGPPRGAAGLESDYLYRQRSGAAKSPAEIAAEERAAEEAARRAAEAARIRAGYERDAIQLRAELGDITGLLAARQAELNTLVAAGVGITKEMADDAMRRYRDELDGTAEATARWAAVIEGAKSPLERALDRFAQLTHDFTEGKISADLYREAHAALTEELKETADATDEVGAGVDRNAKKLADADNAYSRHNEQLGEMRRMSLEVEFGMAGIVGILDQQIETWEDAGQVGLRVLRDIAIQAMYTAAQMQNANLGSILAAGFGVFTGGWGTPTKGSQPYTGSGKGASVGEFHSGGIIGNAPPMTRFAPFALFENAPRNHRGYPLAPDERAAILQVGEPVVSRWDANRIMGAVERSGGGGGVKVNIHNYAGGDVEARERTGPGGEAELDVFIGRKVNAHIASGQADGAMAQRYGLQRAVGGR